MRVVQTIALLSVATLVPSAAGIALPRVEADQSRRRFPRNDTAIATAPDGSTTRLSPFIPTLPTTTTATASASASSHESWVSSSTGQTSSVESLDRITIETTSSSWSEVIDELPLTTTELDKNLTTLSTNTRITPATQQLLSNTGLSLTAERLDHDLTTSSPSTEATLSAQRLSSESSSLLLSQVTSVFDTSANHSILPLSSPSSRDQDAISLQKQGEIQASMQRRPHQGFAHPLTPTALNNTKLQSHSQTCGPGLTNPCAWIPSPSATSRRANGTYTPGPWTSGTLTVIAPTPLAPCTTLEDDEPVTEYSIVYTATVTFFGNVSEYTPPYPTISTPNFCDTEPLFPTLSKGPGNVGGPLPSLTEGVSSKEPPRKCIPGRSCSTEKVPDWSNPTATAFPGAPELTWSSMRSTVTFVTTDKNPAVVFTTDPPPRFDRATRGGGLPISDKQKPRPTNEPRPNRLESSEDHDNGIPQPQPTSGEQSSGRPQRQPRPDSEPQPELEPGSGSGSGSSSGSGSGSDSVSGSDSGAVPTKKFVVTARGQEVIVNGKTFLSLKPDQVKTVTVDKGTFTIRPTEVAGEGATIRKPRPIGTVVSVISPTSTTFGQVPITVSGTEAVIGGTTLKIPLIGTTMRLEIPTQGLNTLIEERKISINANRIVVDDETFKYHGVGGPQTDVIIEGGEMVTAVGQSVFVFRSTTLTYGPHIPGTTKTIDDDVITVGPGNVVIDRTTFGGSEAKPKDTKYRIVGGATITKVNPSYAIVDETTFTAGPGAKRTTKEAGGETITIGPDGITIGTITVKYPFGASTVTTIEAKETASEKLPAASGTNSKNAVDSKNGNNDDDDDDSGATGSRLTMGMTGLCIAVGVWILV